MCAIAQRDLLPLIEGCSVATKYGTVNTDHILFIASGAFVDAKPSDLLAELQVLLESLGCVELLKNKSPGLYLFPHPQSSMISLSDCLSR